MFEILVVDDEKDICWALEAALEEEGFRVTPISRGEEAVKEACARSFDVAIVDVKLPGISGIEVSQALRRIDPGLKILMLSGYYYEEDPVIQEGLRRGDYTGFLAKPFVLDEVSALLRRVIKEGGASPSPQPSCGDEGQTERR